MAEERIERAIMCAKCPDKSCYLDPKGKKPNFCPIIKDQAIIENAIESYKGNLSSFFKASSRQEKDGYIIEAGFQRPYKCRVEEIIDFAKKMQYERLGIAFCIGFKNEALMLTKILEEKEFEIVSVCCKCGGIDKTDTGLKEEDKIIPGRHESTCNPIAQAKLLNSSKTSLNIVLGLCVGHDSLFFKHSEAPSTVLAVKDRLLGHNPLAALYSNYYQRIFGIYSQK